MSATPVAVTVIVGFVPGPAVIGAVQTLISVPSDGLAVRELGEGVAGRVGHRSVAVAVPALQTPTSTTSRLPAATFGTGVPQGVLAAGRLLGDLLHEGRCRLAGRG